MYSTGYNAGLAANKIFQIKENLSKIQDKNLPLTTYNVINELLLDLEYVEGLLENEVND